MFAARALLRRQPLRLAPIRRANTTLNAAAAASSATNAAPPPPTPAPAPAVTNATASAPSLKTVVQARTAANTSTSSSKTKKSAASDASAPVEANSSSDGSGSRGRRAKKSKKKLTKGQKFTGALRARRTRWRPPVAPGVLPVYDLALKYIARDAARLRIEVSRVRSELAELEAKEGAARDEGEVAKMKEKVRVLEVQSEINRPVVRWMAFTGRGK